MGKKRNKVEAEEQTANDSHDGSGQSNDRTSKRQKKDSKKTRKGQARAKDAVSLGSPKDPYDDNEMKGLAAWGTASLPSTSQRPRSKPVFVEKTFRITVALLPVDLRSTVAAVENSLRASLLRYNDQMGGVLLAFWDVAVQDNGRGRILDDLPHIHYTLTCAALLFRPEIGSILVGNVKESFPSHISATVAHYFNASIPTDALHARGFAYDNETLEWRTRYGSPASAGCQIEFELRSLHESGGIISLEGAMPSVVQEE